VLRPSSPLNAKASVRSPYALDRSQQNSCVGTVAAGSLGRSCDSPHMRFVVCLMSKSVLEALGSAGLTLHSRCQTTRPKPGGNCDFLDRGLVQKAGWWSQTGSNRRPHACKARALPTELWPHRETRERSVSDHVSRAPVLRASAKEDGRPGQTRTADLTLIRRTL
jgi:hypothetical protein